MNAAFIMVMDLIYLIVKHSKGRPLRDLLLTLWKVGSYVDRSLKITWEERIVREEKYSILIRTS